ncbi:MAG: CDP-alcohol phosphatidyltransferase family protein [Oscillospiraceae bacterium]
MITPKQIAEKTMTPAKREEARHKYFDFYIGRPISYVLTIPFLYTSITPNMVTYLSFVFCFIGFGLVSFGTTVTLRVLGSISFFVWAILDAVDGNIARYKKVTSVHGDLLDTIGGYLAMVLIFFAFGIGAFYDNQELMYFGLGREWFLILGCVSSICTMFPRLVLHKKLASTKNEKEENALNDLRSKSKFGLPKLIMMNITSIGGIIHVFMIFAIVFHAMGVFTIVYAVINFAVMMASMYQILR